MAWQSTESNQRDHRCRADNAHGVASSRGARGPVCSVTNNAGQRYVADYRGSRMTVLSDMFGFTGAGRAVRSLLDEESLQ